MSEFIFQLKSVVLVILVSEFLKELLSTERFRKYIQFAVSIFLLGFVLSVCSGTHFSLPDDISFSQATTQENLLTKEYETQIANSIRNKLSEHGISVSEITVALSDTYEIETIRITTNESLSHIQAVLEGEFPYEVVSEAETNLESS